MLQFSWYNMAIVIKGKRTTLLLKNDRYYRCLVALAESSLRGIRGECNVRELISLKIDYAFKLIFGKEGIEASDDPKVREEYFARRKALLDEKAAVREAELRLKEAIQAGA